MGFLIGVLPWLLFGVAAWVLYCYGDVARSSPTWGNSDDGVSATTETPRDR